MKPRLRCERHGRWQVRHWGNCTSTRPYWPVKRRRAWWWPEVRLYFGRHGRDPHGLSHRVDEVTCWTHDQVAAGQITVEAGG